MEPFRHAPAAVASAATAARMVAAMQSNFNSLLLIGHFDSRVYVAHYKRGKRIRSNNRPYSTG
ncbi:hypothetical protein CF647_05020 [Burkholderia sp. 117]|nr:hypothetical protein CWD85_07905 [Burkholderia pseudomallei]PNX05641.1 hypothetical protein CF649_05120 [Burkholderia sp. 136(2017)]PNX18186.1 hypothetical protein CF650_01380 [Burkholderia sp. 129]PNX32546.1 hypothetical protein CF647_05020 [Burkholderia sp. 117]PNX41500.1 hypothetical protein CF648_05115 [Burkholderia sp. 137]